MITNNDQQNPRAFIIKLDIACKIYARLSKYDESYRQFRKNIHQPPDFSDRNQCRTLLIWLNAWGCRQFTKSEHERTSWEIVNWYKQLKDELVYPKVRLWELNTKHLETIKNAYESLLRCKADRTRRKTFGPTGASKILFALRPNAIIPWDQAVRKDYSYNGSASSFVNFLQQIQLFVIKTLAPICEECGFSLSKLPQKIGQVGKSITKLIDEYHWITITKSIQFTEDDIQRWIYWTKIMKGKQCQQRHN